MAAGRVTWLAMKPALVLLMVALRLSAGSMSAEDRQHLVVHLQMTEQWLSDEVRGLSTAQLNFRPGADRWSVRECVSHLAVAEPDYWCDFMDAVKSAPRATKSDRRNRDDEIRRNRDSTLNYGQSLSEIRFECTVPIFPTIFPHDEQSGRV